MFDAEVWMCCTWAMHVSVTYYAGIASRVQVFFAVLLKKIEYLLETKVSNRLLLVLGVISPRAKSLFCFFFWHFCFLLLTCVSLSMFSGFEVSRGGFFVCFWGNFRIICFFKAFLAKCLRQKCEYVVPEQCMFTWHTMW